MEEDIKILENSIKEVEDNKDIGFFENKEDLKFYNAVKHLIKAYKELEEENRIFALEGCRVRLKMYIYNNYIPVSFVEEKIEYYKELQNNYIKKYDEVNDGLQAMINVLQELLEERKVENGN